MAVFGDISAMINVGAVLVLIISLIMVGATLNVAAPLALGGVFGSALPYIISVMRMFQPLFDLLGNIIPFLGIFIKDLPDILALIVNQIGFEARSLGIIAFWFGRFMWGVLFGVPFTITKRFLDRYENGLQRGIITLFGVFLSICVFMLMLVQLSNIGCGYVDSLCSLQQGMYAASIPLFLIGTFIANIGLFSITLKSAYDRGGLSGENLKENAIDIFSTMFIIGVFSFRVWIPAIAGWGMSSGIVTSLPW
ncbi:MAG: hypothetical protein GON13_01200 [Nanoarchaeota archaeon]|nr:hypothetical protein [Nanoarchaeota archaeon]